MAKLPAAQWAAFMKLMVEIRIHRYPGTIPLADVDRGWRDRQHLRETDWRGMLQAAEKARILVVECERLVIVEPVWLEALNDQAIDRRRAEELAAKAARMRECRRRKRAAAAAARGATGATVAPRGNGADGARGATVAPGGAPLIREDRKGDKEESSRKEEEEKTGKETAVEPPAGAGAVSTAAAPPPAAPAAASSTGPPPEEDFKAHPTWPGLLKQHLLHLAFGSRATVPQKHRLQETIEEARERGATLGLIYRRVDRRRQRGENIFAAVRNAGLDARQVLQEFRALARVDTLTFPEIEALAFDTTARQGMQQQADWDALRERHRALLEDVKALPVSEVTAITSRSRAGRR
jgi:hypothetical protein